MLEKRKRILLLIIILIGATLRCIQLPTSSLWFDEANSYYIAKQPPFEIFQTLYNDVSEPIYYFILKGWMYLVGEGDIQLALLSVIFSITSIYLIYLLAKEIFGDEAIALTASFLVAVNRQSLFQATNIRFYPLLELITPLCFLLFWKMMKGKRIWIPYAACSFIGVMTHSYFWLVLFSQLAIAPLLWGKRVAFQYLWKPALTVLILYLPWSFIFVHQMRNNIFGGVAELGGIYDAFRLFSESVFIKLSLPFSLFKEKMFLTIPFMILLAYCSLYNRKVRALAMGYLIMVGIPILLSFKKPIFLPGRYDIITLCISEVMIAALGWWIIDQLKNVPYRKIVSTAFCGYLILCLFSSFTFLRWKMEVGTDKQVALGLSRWLQDDDIVLFTTIGYLTPKYYLDQFNAHYRNGNVFPKEFSNLPGHVNHDIFQEKSSYDLEKEASKLAEDLDNTNFRYLVVLTTENPTYFGKLLLPLHKALNSKFKLKEKIPTKRQGEVQSSFFDTLLIYERKEDE